MWGNPLGAELFSALVIKVMWAQIFEHNTKHLDL